MADEPQRRFYCPDLAAGTVALPPDEARHALKSLRLAAGDRVVLFDGRGGSAAGAIADTGRGAVTVAVDAVATAPLPPVGIHLATAVPKAKRMDWLAEKAAELGVRSFRAVRFERGVAGGGGFSAGRRARCLKRFIAAAKQCGLDRLPELRAPLLAGELAARADAGPLLFGDTAGDAVPLREALGGDRPPAGITVVVGPEGGLTDGERGALARNGGRPVRIGATVLRVETAAVALVAAVAAAYG